MIDETNRPDHEGATAETPDPVAEPTAVLAAADRKRTFERILGNQPRFRAGSYQQSNVAGHRFAGT